ncbi:MAG: FAS1-like dehydratase domain-containing protein [Haloechinothrix sp.]
MSWEPHTITTEEVVEHGPVVALSALFDDGIPAPAIGDDLPPLWHWVALSRWPRSSSLDVDGHPARGSFLPPIDLPRRMFAGGGVVFHSGLRIGSAVRRESTVESVTEKDGRSGRLVVVVVESQLFDEHGALAVEETQDFIYRDAGAVGSTEASAKEAAPDLAPVGAPLRRAGEWTWDFATDPTLLMRFSAASSNPHRIHYDWPYATRVEGYPGLVVHGPLMTLALAEVLRLEQHPARVARLRHRNRKPLFCGQPAQLRRAEEATPDAVTLGLFGPDAGPHTTLTIEFDSSQKGSSHA